MLSDAPAILIAGKLCDGAGVGICVFDFGDGDEWPLHELQFIVEHRQLANPSRLGQRHLAVSLDGPLRRKGHRRLFIVKKVVFERDVEKVLYGVEIDRQRLGHGSAFPNRSRRGHLE